jgi:hypothetical protein
VIITSTPGHWYLTAGHFLRKVMNTWVDFVGFATSFIWNKFFSFRLWKKLFFSDHLKWKFFVSRSNNFFSKGAYSKRRENIKKIFFRKKFNFFSPDFCFHSAAKGEMLNFKVSRELNFNYFFGHVLIRFQNYSKIPLGGWARFKNILSDLRHKTFGRNHSLLRM